MQGWLLQDWVTIRGASSVAAVAQAADEWLDIGEHEDLAFFLDVREVSGAQIVYETSPTRQEQSFVPLVGAITPSIGQRVDRVFATFSSAGPARYVRWKVLLSGGAAWDVTFRVWVAAYAWVKG